MNKIFSGRLWAEGMRRLRLAGFLTLGFVTVNAVLVPLIYFVGGTFTYEMIDGSPVAGISAHPFIVAVFTVAAPIMTLILFSFLNKRRSSDFFHSLPYTRLCTVISFFAALLTWLFGIIIGSTLTAAASHALLGNAEFIPSLFEMLPGVLIVTFQVCAGVALAMGITGTLFSNVAVSALILFFPSFCLGVFNLTIVESMNLIVPERFLPIAIQKLNILAAFSPIGLIGSAISDDAFMTPLNDPAAWTYSFILSAILFALACVAFCKRKSEMAGRSAPNKYFNAVYRTVITLLVCIPVCAMIYSDTSRSVPLVVYVFLYTIAVTAWIVWELIASRRWAKVAKSLPSLLIVAAVNAVLVFTLFGAKNAILSFEPNAEDIISATVTENRTRQFDMAEYGRYLAGGTDVTDKESLGILCGALSDAVKANKAGEPYRYINQGGRFGDYTVRFETSRGAVYRYFFIRDSDFARIRFNKAASVAQMSVRIPGSRLLRINSGTEIKGDILAVMREELAGADPEEWYGFSVGYSSARQDRSIVEACILAEQNVEVYVPITAKFFPKATRMFIDAERSIDSLTFGDMAEIFEKFDPYGSEAGMSADVFLYDEENGWYTHEYYLGDDLLGPDDFSDEEIRTGDSFAQLSFYCYNGQFKEGVVTLKLTDEGMRKIAEGSAYFK